MLKWFSLQHYLPIQIIMIGGIGLLLGIAVLTISPVMLLVGLIGVVYIVVVVKWPEIALLGTLILTSTIIDVNALPPIPFGIGHLIISDIVLIIPLGIVLIKTLTQPRFKLNHTPLDFPLLGFYGIAILSTIIAIYQRSVSFNNSLGEIRIANFYLIFYIVTNLICDKKRLRRLLEGILLLSLLVAIAMIVQYFVGDAIDILPGRVETLITAGVTSTGITRVLPPGQSLVMVGFITTIILLIVDRTRSFPLSRIIQASVLGLAVLLTFNRNFWVGIGLALLLMGCLIPLPNKIRLLKIILATLFLAIVLIPAISSVDSQVAKLIDASTSRFATLFNSNTLNEDSLQYRYIENSYAFPQIALHPLIGLGLGTNYRPWDPRIDPSLNQINAWDNRGYIHNGHLWVMLKTGLIGYFLLMFMILYFLKRSFQNWHLILDPFFRGFVLSFSVTIAGLLVTAFVNPIFYEFYWVPILGIMMGMNETIFGLIRVQTSGLSAYDKL
jgi:hypothetical protein